MNTAEGEIVHVEGASLKDFADGKRLFSKFTKAINRCGGAKYSELVAMGVIEGGTESGQTSLMFLCSHIGKDAASDQFFIFEISQPLLGKLFEASEKCEAYFDAQLPGEKQ